MTAYNVLPKTTPQDFLFLHAIQYYDAQTLTALSISFSDNALWCLIETCAQAACLHQRFLKDFADHAFFLSLDSFSPPPTLTSVQQVLICCQRCGQSALAASYTIAIKEPTQQTILSSLQLTVGHKAYDASFQETLLRTHYSHLWQKLVQQGKLT